MTPFSIITTLSVFILPLTLPLIINSDDLSVPSNSPFSSTIIWSAEISPINLFLINIDPVVLYLPSKTPSPSNWEKVSKFFTLSFNGEDILHKVVE